MYRPIMLTICVLISKFRSKDFLDNMVILISVYVHRVNDAPDSSETAAIQ
jgi:hypothetical protein